LYIQSKKEFLNMKVKLWF